ncbi:uncharacterized protein K452DRAFT_355091 [Aplosporella prunicola CBS 121167]|uniref:Checkpoint protein RAD24-like helical bundle domain-containing protein n=1 Tax=Aplosporella prunicola CBS 121167 TaxID=1176127 RepID=A0A6A6BVA5_9PEZI|nr:uncharacterized protein K452DRAFT_355091 [Aplosporella prunicola CBS 121167]KAF2146611.1 hypothetical protein K452DRAFT_355091 [Aplosporella prunicola CBS 121167]
MELHDTSSSASSVKPLRDKSLYSFFSSSATQRQPSQSSPSPEHEADAIQEYDSGDSAHEASVRPRKRPRHGSDDARRGSQKFLKPSSAAKKHPAEVPPHRPWVEKYAPVNLDELAVHKKKVADVRKWLAAVLQRRDPKRLLILKGAAGTAKTTTLHLLSKELMFDLIEWKNPTGSDFSSDNFVSLSTHFEDFMSRSGKFGSLELGGPQGTASDTSAGRQVILIEDFPNTFARSSSALQAFQTSVQRYLSSSIPLGKLPMYPTEALTPVTPIVMVISETLLSTSTAAADSFTAHRLLGPDIMNHPGTSVIEFNAIAPTILTKALELVVNKEARQSGRRTTPGPQVIKKLAEIGDVRSAIFSLEFLCVRGDESADWGSKVTFKGPAKGSRGKPLTKMEQESLAMVTQRESKLGIFHAVGKVVYNKRDEPTGDSDVPQPPYHLPQHIRPKPSEVKPDTLLDELGTDISTFIAALHENYILSCNTTSEEDTFDAINGCIDALSDADLLSPDRFSAAGLARRTHQGTGADSSRQEEMSFQASVRGLLFSLPYPVNRSLPPPGMKGGRTPLGAKSDAYRMFYPTSARLWHLREEIEGLLDLSFRRAQMESSAGTPREAITVPSHGNGSVETWGNNGGFNRKRQQSHEGDGSAVPPALGLGGMAKREMLLERLPYMATVLRRGGSTSGPAASRLREIEKIVDFRGVNIGSGDDLTEDFGRDVEDQQWHVEQPVMFEPARAGNVVGSNEEGLEKLVLSDDDIQDD